MSVRHSAEVNHPSGPGEAGPARAKRGQGEASEAKPGAKPQQKTRLRNAPGGAKKRAVRPAPPGAGPHRPFTRPARRAGGRLPRRAGVGAAPVPQGAGPDGGEKHKPASTTAHPGPGGSRGGGGGEGKRQPERSGTEGEYPGPEAKRTGRGPPGE